MTATDTPVRTLIDPDLIRWVAKAHSKDKARPALAVVAFDGTKVVATDSYRMHVGDIGTAELDGLRLPADQLTKALTGVKAHEVVGVSRDGDTAVIHYSSGHKDTRPPVTIDAVTDSNGKPARFPDWEQLVPATFERKLTVKSTFGATGKDAGVLSRFAGIAKAVGGAAPTTFDLNQDGPQKATIRWAKGEATEEFTAVQYEGEPLKIAVSAGFLLDAFASTFRFEHDVTVELRDELKPVVVRNKFDSRMALVMPVRV